MNARILICFALALAGCESDSALDAIGPGNQGPTIEAPENVAAIQDQPVSFTVTATDPEGDSFTLDVYRIFSQSELLGGGEFGPSSFDAATGEVTFTPKADDVPQRWFEAEAIDDRGNESIARIRVHVSQP